MSGDFLDTNIFGYVFDGTAPDKRDRAAQIVGTALLGGNAVISHQVVQETLHLLTARLRPVMPAERAASFFDSVLRPLWRVEASPALYVRALETQQRYGFHFYDSLIVAAAIEGDCDRLLSEDLQHGQRIEGVTIENPFLVA